MVISFKRPRAEKLKTHLLGFLNLDSGRRETYGAQRRANSLGALALDMGQSCDRIKSWYSASAWKIIKTMTRHYETTTLCM